MKNSKRILSVKIIREVDTDPDTSYLGEYSNRATSEYSIDRAHSEDCASLYEVSEVGNDWIQRILCRLADENLGYDERGYEIPDEAAETRDTLESLLETSECDCGGHNYNSREYRYFNPSFNYVDEHGKLLSGNGAASDPEEVRKYVRQDYERMEDLNGGGWCYLGIRVEATIQLTNSSPTQHVVAGGLWGIESDSEKSYLESVEQEELSALRLELKDLGFSTRAISAAFKNVEHKND